MYTLVLTVHIILAVLLVALVLIQQGKGADVVAVMTGGANTLFGVGGASSILVRATTGIAIAFMLTSVALVRLASSGSGVTRSGGDAMSGSVLEGAAVAVAPTVAVEAAVAPTSEPTTAGSNQLPTPSATAAANPQ